MDWPKVDAGHVAPRIERQRIAELAAKRASAMQLDRVYGDGDDVRDDWLGVAERAMADRQRQRDALVRPTTRPVTQPAAATSRPAE